MSIFNFLIKKKNNNGLFKFDNSIGMVNGKSLEHVVKTEQIPMEMIPRRRIS